MSRNELLTPSFFEQKKNSKSYSSSQPVSAQRNLQTFLLTGDEPTQYARGDRHPQRSRLGTPVRGGDTKKGGRGGKGTWEGSIMDRGNYDDMRNGALDRRDPNYYSSSSDEEDQPVASHVAPVQAHSAPAPSFKRIELDQLFDAGKKANGATSGTTSPAKTPVKKKGGKGKGNKSGGDNSSSASGADKFAGGAHQTNAPDAGRLPLPSSLTTTPQKNRTSRSNVASPQQQQPPVSQPIPMVAPVAAPPPHSGNSAVQMEQSLKAMLNIGP